MPWLYSKLSTVKIFLLFIKTCFSPSIIFYQKFTIFPYHANFYTFSKSGGCAGKIVGIASGEREMQPTLLTPFFKNFFSKCISHTLEYLQGVKLFRRIARTHFCHFSGLLNGNLEKENKELLLGRTIQRAVNEKLELLKVPQDSYWSFLFDYKIKAKILIEF